MIHRAANVVVARQVVPGSCISTTIIRLKKGQFVNVALCPTTRKSGLGTEAGSKG